MGNHKGNTTDGRKKTNMAGTIDLTSTAESVEDIRCEAVCSNMFKQCGGVCMKKRGHLGPHTCHHCHYRWNLSTEELSQVLAPRQGI